MGIPYFPGCTLSTQAKNYDRSGRAVAAALGLELVELPEWQCCGATFPLMVDDSMALIAPTRILYQAQATGEASGHAGADARVATLCAICFNVLRRSQALLKRDPQMLERINWFTEQEYRGQVHVMHLLELLRDDVGWEALAERVVRPLRPSPPAPLPSLGEGGQPSPLAPLPSLGEGGQPSPLAPLPSLGEGGQPSPLAPLPSLGEGGKLRVAPYYGCLLLRPYEEIGLDDPEDPTILHDLVRALGAEAVSFPYNIECCGSYLTIKEPGIPETLSKDIVASAREHGAQVIVTACPLCQFNLDYPQRETEAGRTGNEIPVLYFTQLMAIALGLPEEDWGLEGHYADPRPLFNEQ